MRDSLYNKYHDHCHKHAVKESAKLAEPDDQMLYRECMDYFIQQDLECEYCIKK